MQMWGSWRLNFVNHLFKATNPDSVFLTTFLRIFEFSMITQTSSLFLETSIPTKACISRLHKLQSNKTFLRTILVNMRSFRKEVTRYRSVQKSLRAGEMSLQYKFYDLRFPSSSPCSSICIIAINANLFKDTRFPAQLDGADPLWLLNWCSCFFIVFVQPYIALSFDIPSPYQLLINSKTPCKQQAIKEFLKRF